MLIFNGFEVGSTVDRDTISRRIFLFLGASAFKKPKEKIERNKGNDTQTLSIVFVQFCGAFSTNTWSFQGRCCKVRHPNARAGVLQTGEISVLKRQRNVPL